VQGGRTKLNSTTEVAAKQPPAFLAPPARQEHTGPGELLQLSKIPVAGSSHHLISNKETLVLQQDMTRQTALPLAPVTIPSKRLMKVITPLTNPEDSSSDSGASWSTPTSSGASSYQPSSSSSRREEEADDFINAQAGQPAAAQQAREFTKVLDRCAKPSRPAFTAGKPPAYQAESTALQLPAAISKGIAEMVQVCPSLPNSMTNSLVVDCVVCFVAQISGTPPLASKLTCIPLLACFAHLAGLLTPSPLMHCCRANKQHQQPSVSALAKPFSM